MHMAACGCGAHIAHLRCAVPGVLGGGGHVQRTQASRASRNRDCGEQGCKDG
jgi:hypothetical protein